MVRKKKNPNVLVKTLHFKIRNPHEGFLKDGAREVNQAWNYANQVSSQAIRSFAGKATFLSAFDLNKLTSGCTFHETENPNGFKVINVAVVQSINQEYATRRQQFKKSKLRWRASTGPKKSLGWIPFKEENLSIHLDGQRVAGKGAKPVELKPYTRAQAKPGPKKGAKTSAKAKRKACRKQSLAMRQSHAKALQEQKDLPNYTLAKIQPPICLKVMSTTFRVFNEKVLRYHLKNLGAVVKSGNFAQDSLGDWYVNLSVEIDRQVYKKVHLGEKLRYPEIAPVEVVGVDPGAKTMLTLSTGDVLKSTRFYAQSEAKLAALQKAHRPGQAKYVNRKIKRQRQDWLQKTTTEWAKTYQTVKFGDLNIKGVVKRKKSRKENESATQKGKPTTKKQKHGGPRLGKPMLDSSIGAFKQLLSYKCHWAGRTYIEVRERYTTQVCSNCDQFTGPKGLRQLGIRTWTCVGCGITHDRDFNSSINMARIEDGKTLLESVPRCRHLYAEMNRLAKGNTASLGQTKVRRSPNMEAVLF